MKNLFLTNNNFWLFAILVSVLAVFIWAIFQPGFMNADAMVIYGQALTGNYHDWHPPIMAFTLTSFFHMGLGLKELMLVQSLLIYLGLYVASYQLLMLFQVKAAALKAFLVVIGFTLPLSPFPFYAMGFIKDAWCVMSLLWVMGLVLFLYRQKELPTRLSTVLATVITTIVFMVLAILVRHNALVLFPVFMVLIFYLSYEFKLNKALNFVLTVLPLLVYFAFDYYAYDVKEVKPMHAERQVFAAELVGLLELDSTKCESMEYICNYLTDNWREAYEYGEVSSVMKWGWKHAVRFPDFNRNDPTLVRDYYHAVKTYPFSMSLVKLKSFLHMMRPSKHKYWFHGQLDENKYGLALNPNFEKLRKGWIDFSLKIRKPLNMFVADHPLWFVINGLFVFLFWQTRSKTRFSILIFLLLLVPLFYYLSYLLAATTWHYRFMYPSTILIQVVTIALMLWVAQERKLVGGYLKEVKNKYLSKKTTQ